ATRGAALVVVCRVRDDPKQAVQAALERLRFDTDAKVRYAAALLLGDIGREEKAVVPALIDRLENNDPNVRFMAAGALGQIGPAARDAIPALTKAIKDANPLVRVGAALTLEMIQPDKARAARIQNDLAMLMGTSKPGEKEETLRLTPFLEAIVEQAIETVLLIDAAHMYDQRGKQAERALSTLGPEALPIFVTALLRYAAGEEKLAPVLPTSACAEGFFGATLQRLVHETTDTHMLRTLLMKV